MPVYKNRCEQQHEFDIYQKLDDKTLPSCPTFGSSVRKIINSLGYMRLWNGKGYWVLDRQGRSPDWNASALAGGLNGGGW